MKQKAIYYYREGYNCSQCLLKACEQTFNIPISKQTYGMCSAVSNGFGIGGMCSVLIAAIMVFGLLFNESTAKRMRLQLLNRFSAAYSSFNCCDLVKHRGAEKGCEVILGDIADMVESIICENGYSK